VALAYLRNDGTYGEPSDKRTITGLARAGYRRTGKDWIAHLEFINSATEEKVVALFKRRT
jgi:hypothetical protein